MENEYCETCGAVSGLTKSHFVKKNSVAKTKSKDYDYTDRINYFTQCLTCHIEYEQKNKNARFEYLIERRLVKYAARVKWLITL